MTVSHRQLALQLPEPEPALPKMRHGGARPGAGRPKGTARHVAHAVRPEHRRRLPVHVTMRARPGLHTFRCERVLLAFARAIRRAQRDGYRIVHFSIQSNHVHLVVEADDGGALRSGSQGLAIRFARAFNRVFGRRGKTWAERHDRRAVRSPRELRNVLVYVLQNHRKHAGRSTSVAASAQPLDPCSSALWFRGFTRAGPFLERLRASPLARIASPVVAPKSWLLQTGWVERGGGRIHPREAPRESKRR